VLPEEKRTAGTKRQLLKEYRCYNHRAPWSSFGGMPRNFSRSMTASICFYDNFPHNLTFPGKYLLLRLTVVANGHRIFSLPYISGLAHKGQE
jgi:hypothetical protein